MATKNDLLQEAKDLGISVTGDETYKDLQELIKDSKASTGDGAKPSSKEEKSANEGKPVVWVKSTVYVSDEKRLAAGLYRMTPPPRFSKMSSDAVEVFDGEIPPRKLFAIAKWAGITHPEDKKDNELLEALLAEPQFYV